MLSVHTSVMESPRKRQRQEAPQKWLLYLTLDEPEDFKAQLAALKNRCPFFYRSCFQLDGTRHVTVVRAFDMNPEDARQVRAQQPAMSTLLANLRIRVRPWAFNNSNSGIYLDASVPGADDRHTMRNILDHLSGLPDDLETDEDLHM